MKKYIQTYQNQLRNLLLQFLGVRLFLPYIDWTKLSPVSVHFTPDQEQRKREYEQKTKEEQTVKSFDSVVSNKDKLPEPRRAKRYASNSTDVFHVEMMFVIDQNVHAL